MHLEEWEKLNWMRRTDMKFGVGHLCDYSIVVIHGLAKAESRVRISLVALAETRQQFFFCLICTKAPGRLREDKRV